MALASAQAVDAVAALVRNASGMSARVHTGRTWPLEESELPAWRVLAGAESIEAATIGFPAAQTHELDVEAQGYVRAVADLDDAMHALAENALKELFKTASTASLAPLNCAVQLAAIRRDLVTEGEAALGRITLFLRVRFVTQSNSPQTIV